MYTLQYLLWTYRSEGHWQKSQRVSLISSTIIHIKMCCYRWTIWVRIEHISTLTVRPVSPNLRYQTTKIVVLPVDGRETLRTPVEYQSICWVGNVLTDATQGQHSSIQANAIRLSWAGEIAVKYRVQHCIVLWKNSKQSGLEWNSYMYAIGSLI